MTDVRQLITGPGRIEALKAEVQQFKDYIIEKSKSFKVEDSRAEPMLATRISQVNSYF